MNDPIQKLITFLQNKDLSQEQIATECENAAWQASEKFYEELRTILTEEDNHVIDAIQDDPQAQAEMKKRYTTTTGKDPQEVMVRFMEEQVQQIINEYDSSQSSTVTAQ